MKTFEEYEARALRTEMTTLSPRELTIKGALGLAGEAGEVVEKVKKWAFHARALDREALKKELGDVLWYVGALARAQGMSLEEVAEENARKLEARYPTGSYSHEACAARVDEPAPATEPAPKYKSAVFCDHANENPNRTCTCEPDCACRQFMCRC